MSPVWGGSVHIGKLFYRRSTFSLNGFVRGPATVSSTGMAHVTRSCNAFAPGSPRTLTIPAGHDAVIVICTGDQSPVLKAAQLGSTRPGFPAAAPCHPLSPHCLLRSFFRGGGVTSTGLLGSGRPALRPAQPSGPPSLASQASPREQRSRGPGQRAEGAGPPPRPHSCRTLQERRHPATPGRSGRPGRAWRDPSHAVPPLSVSARAPCSPTLSPPGDLARWSLCQDTLLPHLLFPGHFPGFSLSVTSRNRLHRTTPHGLIFRHLSVPGIL